jgi:hypothetical protein
MTGGELKLKVPDVVSWIRDRAQTLVVHEEGRQSHILIDEETALWGWLTCGYEYPELVRMLAVSQRKTEKEAEIQLESVLRRWLEGGILEVVEGESRG